MENGSIADAVIANRGLNFASPYGGGYGHGGREFASDASNAVRIQASERSNDKGQDFISQQISDNADRNRDAASLAAMTTGFSGINDKIGDQSIFITSQLNQISREASAAERRAAECCCEAKLLAVQNQAKTDAGLATIIANQDCDSKIALAVANAEQNAKLNILLAEKK